MRTLLNYFGRIVAPRDGKRGVPGSCLIVLAALLVFQAAPGLVRSAHSAGATITEKDTGGTLSYKVGSQFKVDAPHPGDVFVIPPPTFNPKILRMTARQDPPEPGKPGRVVFTFTVIRPGQTTLLVRYFNPDDKEAPQVQILRVTINAVR